MVITIHTDYFLCHIWITLYIILTLWQHILTVSWYLKSQYITVNCRIEV